MRNHKYGPLLAVVLSACTFTTADVGPTAQSLRNAHDALATEFSALDALVAPSAEMIAVTCPDSPVAATQPQTIEDREQREEAFLVAEFCTRWGGLDADGLARQTATLALRPRVNEALVALLAYIDALDALVKSREQSELQADLLEARLNGLNGVSAALGGSATLISGSAVTLFTEAANAFDHYNRSRAALRAAEHAQDGLDYLALGVREAFGECQVALSEAMLQRLQWRQDRCNDAAKAVHERITRGIVFRESRVAELRNEVEYTLYRSEAPGALRRLQMAYDARAREEEGSQAYNDANRAIDVALRDLNALDVIRPQHDAVVARQRTIEEWAVARARGRTNTVRAFMAAADQNAALVEAIRRDRQLDLGPLGFVIRSLLGA